MKHLLTLIFVFVSLYVGAQQYYPIFTQNYANPFLVNPSYLTLDRRPEVNLTYRQQWVGITDGPKTMQFDIQYPFSRRISIGLNFYNDQSVLLNNSGGLATFGYRVPINSKQLLAFGLSAGFVSNQLDLDGVPDVDLIDPVLLNSSDNFDFDGQFGLHYQIGNFTLGLSLLKLVDNRPFSEGSVQSEKFDVFKDRAAILGYRLNISEDISMVPTVYYRATYSGYEYFEGSLLVNYRDVLTIGGGYRMDLGPHAVIRIRFKGLQAGYSYDFPNTRYGGSTGGTHEVQVKFQFGHVMDPLQVLARNDSVPPSRNLETKAEDRTDARAAEEVEPAPTSVPTPADNTEVEPPVNRTSDETISPKPLAENVENRKSDIPENDYPRNVTYQLVVGTFARKVHAERFVRQLFAEGYLAKVVTSKGSELFYVVVPSFQTKAISLDKVLEIRNKTQFKDAWFKEFD